MNWPTLPSHCSSSQTVQPCSTASKAEPSLSKTVQAAIRKEELEKEIFSLLYADLCWWRTQRAKCWWQQVCKLEYSCSASPADPPHHFWWFEIAERRHQEIRGIQTQKIPQPREEASFSLNCSSRTIYTTAWSCLSTNWLQNLSRHWSIFLNT